MNTFAIRFNPGDDLKAKLIEIVKDKEIKAGLILTCVGSLDGACLRMAGAKETKKLEGQFEIVSLVGTLCQDDVHLHISISGEEGHVFGGHLKEGCMIDTTAEIVIGELKDSVFNREFDEKTGYKELSIERRNNLDGL